MKGHKQLVAEVQFLGVADHSNIIKLIGLCTVDAERGMQQLLVYESVPNKSVEDHFFRNFHDALPWQTGLKIILGVPQGLAYVHEELEAPVIFRDFTTSDILPDEELNRRYKILEGTPIQLF
ncbi:hypothetical protein R6Q59_006212 [Mikania micrantha]